MTNEAMREKLVTVANLLKDLTMAVVAVAEEFGEVKVVEKAPEEQTKAAEPAKKYSMEDVRKVLAEKSSAGFTAEVRALLEKHVAVFLPPHGRNHPQPPRRGRQA